MKKVLFILTTVIILSSCATSREGGISRSDERKERKLAEQEMIKNAVESRRFIVKFEHFYPAHGGIINLYPKYNYIVVDGEKAIINAAYFGRQYDIRPIAGFNMHGKTMRFEADPNYPAGLYEITMRVANGKNSFDVDLAIGKDGNCTASITNAKTDFVRYRGYIVPIKEKGKDM